MSRRDPFKFSGNQDLANIADQAKLTESVQFMLKSTKLGTEINRKYYETRFEQKSAKLFDYIPKTKKTT